MVGFFGLFAFVVNLKADILQEAPFIREIVTTAGNPHTPFEEIDLS